MSALVSGTIVDGRYRVIRPLGAGTVGTVYEVEHVHIGARFALKLVADRRLGTPAVEARFQREARTAAALDNPHIVRVTDFGTHEGRPYLVMELLEGRTLNAAWWARAFGPAELVRLLLQVLDGLAAAHLQGVVHRDLKPDNLFVVERNGERSAKILDFGLAKLLQPTDDLESVAGAVFGTPRYMSPEQAAGDEIDTRADLYAIGVILFELLAGQPPFQGLDATEVLRKHMLEPPPPLTVAGRAPGLDVDQVAEVVRWTLAKRREDRPATAEDLRRALAAALGSGSEALAGASADDLRRGLTETLPPPSASAGAEAEPGSPGSERPPARAGEPRGIDPAAAMARPSVRRWPAVGAALALAMAAGLVLWSTRPSPPPARRAMAKSSTAVGETVVRKGRAAGVEPGAETPPALRDELPESPTAPATPSAGEGSPRAAPRLPALSSSTGLAFVPPAGFEGQVGPPYEPLPLGELDVARELARRREQGAAEARFRETLAAHPGLSSRPELRRLLSRWARTGEGAAVAAMTSALAERVASPASRPGQDDEPRRRAAVALLADLARRAPTFGVRRAAYEGLERLGAERRLGPGRYLAGELRRNGTEVCRIRRWYVERLAALDDPELRALLREEKERRGGFLNLERKGACLDEVVDPVLAADSSRSNPGG